jgi:hypothetical protein
LLLLKFSVPSKENLHAIHLNQYVQNFPPISSHVYIHHNGDKIEKYGMGRACSSDGEREEACTWYWWGKLRERGHWGDTGVDSEFENGSSRTGVWGYGLD